MSALPFVPTRVLFFTGKGGVGKTSLACATAIALADSGKRVLLVSTDPASNLDEVLGVTLDASPNAVPGVPGLSALNIDPEQAARAYRERVVGPYRGCCRPPPWPASKSSCLVRAPSRSPRSMSSRSCSDADATRAFDHVIFDTAPTGHTLRLLELPAAWSSFIETNVGGTSCLGPLGPQGAALPLRRLTRGVARRARRRRSSWWRGPTVRARCGSRAHAQRATPARDSTTSG